MVLAFGYSPGLMTYREAFIPLGVLLVLGCNAFGKTARIAPPVEAGAEDQRRFALAHGEASQVSVLVEDRPWSSSTRKLLVQHSVLFLEVRNRGQRAVRYRTEDLVLHVNGEEYEAVPVERILNDADPGVQEARMAKTEGIRGATLEPGDSRDGFVFFRKKIPGDEAVDGKLKVTLSLYDTTHENLIEAIPIPLVVVE